ncbi:MAG: siroheme synthase [Acetobacteraceae bacterium]|nr:siroheme synthase [Acetobacteraceae bacterium]
MLPLVFTRATPVLLAGDGPAFEKRAALLDAAGMRHVSLHRGRPPVERLDAARLVFGAGLPEDDAEWLAAEARARRVPVNIEDVPHLCDVHVPAMVRRGELLLTVSTGGGAPAVASAVRARLEALFGEEWGPRLAEIAAERQRLRAAGVDFHGVNAALRAMLERDAPV